MPKIIHCADVHLDAKMSANLPPEKAKERRNELLLTFRRMVEFAGKEGAQAVIIAGDLYDKKNISATAANTVFSLIRENPGISFFCLRGNHDPDTLLREADPAIPNLKLFSSEEWRSYALGDTGLVITGAELKGKSSRHFFDELVLDRNAYNILVLHGQVENTSAGKEESNVKTPIIPLKALQNKGIDYLALGHIHARMAGKLDGRGIWSYPGCLEGRGFDECGEHGFLLLDIEPSVHSCSVTFISAACRNLYEVRTDISGCNNSQEALRAIEEALSVGAYESKDLLKVLLTGETEPGMEINTEYLNRQLEERFYYIRVLDETTLRIRDEDFACDPSLKGEFVRRVRASGELTEEEKSQVIRNGIRLLMGENIYED